MQKHSFRTLGLSLLAALSLMALGVAGAQAANLVNGTTNGAGKIKILGADASGFPISATGEQEGSGTLLIPALNTEIVCEKLTVVAANTKITSIDGGSAEVLYEKCEYWGTKTTKHVSGVELLELTVKLPCEILEDSATLAAKAITAKGTLLVFLHEGRSYVLAEGAPFASVLITTPSECPLPKLVNVSGSLVFEVTTGDLNVGGAVLKILIKASKALSGSGLFPDKLLFGANTAYVDGSAEVWLASDCTWGVI